MWYVSWHPLLHKDMPGHHIISRICFPSPPQCPWIQVIKKVDCARCVSIVSIVLFLSEEEKRAWLRGLGTSQARSEQRATSASSSLFDKQRIIYSAWKFVKAVYLGWNFFHPHSVSPTPPFHISFCSLHCAWNSKVFEQTGFQSSSDRRRGTPFEYSANYCFTVSVLSPKLEIWYVRAQK